MLIDTHAHLNDEKYDNDLEETINRASAVGVKYIINIGTHSDSNKSSLKLANENENIYTTIGIHPHYAKLDSGEIFNEIEKQVTDKKVVAIGETGLDYYKSTTPKEDQEKVFRKLIRVAYEFALPIVLHCRDANQDVMKILNEERAQEIGGVLHCFSGDLDILSEAVRLGFYVAVGGAVTFPDANKLRDSLKYIPLSRLLLETDCPYLAPQSKRGKRNEPAYIPEILDKVSEVLSVPSSDITNWCEKNSRYLFKVGIKENGKIVYQIRDSLYINLTNRCSNHCWFCARNQSSIVKGHDLKLMREPTIEEIIKAIGDPKKYKEIVFCGYGEPLIRLGAVLSIAKELKNKGAIIRIDTNGQANLIHSENIVPKLSGLIDSICISLNASNEQEYLSLCSSQFGIKAYKEIKDFILECKKHIPEVTATIVTVPGINVEKCKNIVYNELGVNLKIREYGKVG